MPSSGTLNGNNVDGTEGSYLSWQVTSQNVAGNYSTLAWQVGWRFSTVGCRGLRQGSAVINGTTVYNDQDPGDGVHGFVNGHNHRPALQTASGSINVAHNVDGTKTFAGAVQMKGWDNGGPNLHSLGNASWALPVIPRLTSAPSKPVITNILSTSMFATFTDGSGGAPIDSRQIAYSTNPNEKTNIIASDGSTSITGLDPGVTYYIWARTHNVAGFSPWSPRAEATTHRVPDAPSSPVLSSITQTSMVATFTPNFNGGTPITEYVLGYALTPITPTTSVTVTLPHTIIGLSPGVRYYFWGRVKNAVGFSPLSAPSSATTIAGARIKVGAVYKNAIPYVKVSGVWKLARPWVRRLGIWKETI